MKVPQNGVLILTVLNNLLTNTIVLDFLVLTKNGSLQHNVLQLVLTISNGVSTASIPLQVDELICYRLSELGGLPAPGNCGIVQLGVLESGINVPICTLSIGSIDNSGSHSWNEQQTPTEWDVRHPLAYLQIGPPAAGAIQDSVFGAFDIIVEAIRFTYVADANVATRTILVQQTDPLSNVIQSYAALATLAAGATGIYQFSTLGVDRSISASTNNYAIPPMRIRRAEHFQIVAFNMQVGDQISSIRMQTRTLPSSY